MSTVHAMTATERITDAMVRVAAMNGSRPFTYFWTVWNFVLVGWQRDQGVSHGRPHMDVLFTMTMDELHARAVQARQIESRTETWVQATFSAQIGYGDTARNTVLRVLHSWAKAEDEDRWVATLPPCDAECVWRDEEFSQSSHLIGCARGRAWRERYKMDRA